MNAPTLKQDDIWIETQQKKRIKHILSIHDLKSYRQTIVTEKDTFPEYFTQLIALLRPQKWTKKENNTYTADKIIELKQIDEVLKKDTQQDPKKFGQYMGQIFSKKDYFLRFLTDIGVLPNKTFLAEASRKISQKILPAYNSSNSLLGLLEATFTRKKDYQWLQNLADERWVDLFNVLGFQPIHQLNAQHPFIAQTLEALGVLSFRITTIAIEPEIVEREPDVELLDSPFFQQQNKVDAFIIAFQQQSKNFQRTPQNPLYTDILSALEACEQKIQLIAQKRTQYGITLDITYNLKRLSDNIDRLKDLLALLLAPAIAEKEKPFEKEILFFKKIIQAHCQKNQLRGYIQQNISLYALNLTEKASKKGEHYITETPKQYFQMLFSALIGGFVVGFLSIFKALAGALEISKFGKAFLFSANYSIGFMGIHLLGGTLATKQPAVTASTFAEKLQTNEEDGFGRFIAQFSRSQLIAILGNVLIAFPVAYFVATYYYEYTGLHVVSAKKAHHLIEDLHPFYSPALLHAAIAGVYLFWAGLIAGYHDNWMTANQIGERIRKSPFIRNNFSLKWGKRIATFFERNTGALAGNFYLGILLGSTYLVFEWIGMFINVPLNIDIRHITFAAGNLGLSLVALNNHLEATELGFAIAGILGIGIVNILVSFSLSLTVAVLSRRMSSNPTEKEAEMPLSIGRGFALGFRYFLKRPWEFFLPIYKSDYQSKKQ